jgi:Tfp pilus assembly protein PilF
MHLPSKMKITQTIAATLRVRLGQAGQQVEGTRRIDAEARELNLRGRYWLNRRTPPDLWKAIAYFSQALEKDPAYAQAYLGLAEAYSTLGANDQASPREVLPKARAAAQQALRWDESSGESHAVFAWITFLDGWNSALAEQEFRRALELCPNYPAAHQWYGLTLMLEQRFDESLREFNLAQDLDPLSLILSTDKGVVYYYSGRRIKRSNRPVRFSLTTRISPVPTFYWGWLRSDSGSSRSPYRKLVNIWKSPASSDL